MTDCEIRDTKKQPPNVLKFYLLPWVQFTHINWI